MVEIILSEHQLACLKAAVPRGSGEHAALEAGDYFAGSEITPRAHCRHVHMQPGTRTAVARHCSDVMPRCRRRDSPRNKFNKRTEPSRRMLDPAHVRRAVSLATSARKEIARSGRVTTADRLLPEETTGDSRIPKSRNSRRGVESTSSPAPRFPRRSSGSLRGVDRSRRTHARCRAFPKRARLGLEATGRPGACVGLAGEQGRRPFRR
jgi:hypothetical protein